MVKSKSIADKVFEKVNSVDFKCIKEQYYDLYMQLKDLPNDSRELNPGDLAVLNSLSVADEHKIKPVMLRNIDFMYQWALTAKEEFISQTPLLIRLGDSEIASMKKDFKTLEFSILKPSLHDIHETFGFLDQYFTEKYLKKDRYQNLLTNLTYSKNAFNNIMNTFLTTYHNVKDYVEFGGKFVEDRLIGDYKKLAKQEVLKPLDKMLSPDSKQNLY